MAVASKETEAIWRLLKIGFTPINNSKRKRPILLSERKIEMLLAVFNHTAADTR